MTEQKFRVGDVVSFYISTPGRKKLHSGEILSVGTHYGHYGYSYMVKSSFSSTENGHFMMEGELSLVEPSCVGEVSCG